MDEARLIAGYLDGDGESHRQVDRWIDEVLRSRHLGLGADREDTAQEARRRLLAAFRHGRFEGRSSLRTYVWRVAQSAAIDQIRHRARRPAAWPLEAAPEPASPAAGPQADLERAEQRLIFGRVLDALSEECRRLWALVVYEELPYRVAARRLGISEGTLKVRALRCRARATEIYRQLVTSPAPQRPSVVKVEAS